MERRELGRQRRRLIDTFSLGTIFRNSYVSRLTRFHESSQAKPDMSYITHCK